MTYCKEHQCPTCALNNLKKYGEVYCVGLSDTRFGAKPCPFYKTEKQMKDGAKRTYERLMDLHEDSLIRVYKLKPTWHENESPMLAD